MYPLYIQSEARQRIEALLHEASATRDVDRLRFPIERKARMLFWYDVLNLPMPLYDARHSTLPQALSYDWLRRRLRSAILTVALAAFGLGVLAGGWLAHAVALLVVILLGCAAALLAVLPLLGRSWQLLRMRRFQSLLHR